MKEQSKETVAASNLETPWSIRFLPGGDMLVSEQSGQLQRIGESGKVIPIAGVRETSEGALLGIALHPDFDDNNRLYLYYTTEHDGKLINTVDMTIFKQCSNRTKSNCNEYARSSEL